MKKVFFGLAFAYILIAVLVIGPWATPAPTQSSISLLSSPVPASPAPKEMELKYDDGKARSFISYTGGHLVSFTSPTSPFMVTRIAVMGLLGGSTEDLEARRFDLEIWDKDKMPLYSNSFPYTKFPGDTGGWVEIEIPEIKVEGVFYVHLYTNSSGAGLLIGADDSVANEHSDVTIRTADGITGIVAMWPWLRHAPWYSGKSRVNWMIRVTGRL